MLGDHQSVAQEIHCNQEHLLIVVPWLIPMNSVTYTDPRDGADDSIPDTTPVRDSMSCDS